MQVAAPFSLAAPVTETETVVLSPDGVPHAPPTVVTIAFVRYGNVRAVPLTEVSVTTGAVLSTVIDCAPLVPVLPARVALRRGDGVGAVGRERGGRREGPGAGGAGGGAVLRARAGDRRPRPSC